jgi:hypothetical protein
VPHGGVTRGHIGARGGGHQGAKCMGGEWVGGVGGVSRVTLAGGGGIK